MSIPRDPLPKPQRDAAIDPAVVDGIRQASRATHVDFAYLMAQAAQESGFRPDARSPTSSASGLFQFIDTTWLDMVRQHGAKYGVGDLARRITADGAGRPVVGDHATRARILDLRRDPRLSAALAAEFALANKGEVERSLGRPATHTDLYLAHFLGAGGATQLLKAVKDNSATPAAAILPEAAAANRAVFFHRDGRGRTVGELYAGFVRRIEGAAHGADAAPGLRDKEAAAAALGTMRNRNPQAPPSPIFNSLVLTALHLIGGPAGGSAARGPAAPPVRHRQDPSPL